MTSGYSPPDVSPRISGYPIRALLGAVRTCRGLWPGLGKIRGRLVLPGDCEVSQAVRHVHRRFDPFCATCLGGL